MATGIIAQLKGNFRAEISLSALIRKYHLRRYIYRYRILEPISKLNYYLRGHSDAITYT